MEEVKEPEKTLAACLHLLNGNSDEQKIAGMLLSAKYLNPNEVNQIVLHLTSRYRNRFQRKNTRRNVHHGSKPSKCSGNCVQRHRSSLSR